MIALLFEIMSLTLTFNLFSYCDKKLTDLFDLVTLSMAYELFIDKLYLPITLQPEDICLSCFVWVFRGNRVSGAYNFWPVCLFVRVSVEFFNFANNFYSKRHTAFIFHMCIPCDKAFPLVYCCRYWINSFVKMRTLPTTIDYNKHADFGN